MSKREEEIKREGSWLWSPLLCGHLRGGGILLPKPQCLVSIKATHYTYVSASGLWPLLQKGTLASFLPPLFGYPEHPA